MLMKDFAGKIKYRVFDSRRENFEISKDINTKWKM